ncbi:hypothetical protein BJ875DRAFT_499399 [Amylocarpus encephaloides]|uniref:Uncharacterized protein n=1 Tax=Amylocarpus encephaloides TaxID=45428 RepID=A0A9P7YAF8_9HELO|nr:hypothetical protein BJ875DRAFT_499399 [Amylocarpus encephaloides]
MSQLRIALTEYGKWMDIYAILESGDVLRFRRERAVTLRNKIREGHIDAETLEELTHILDHECLCLALGNASNEQNLPRSRAALAPQWTGLLIAELSECLLRTITPKSYYERELQFRALFSALVLQSAQCARAYQATYYQHLWSLIHERHRDLQWLQLPSEELTSEAFRHLESSYLLVATTEYAMKFRKEEPIVVTILLRAVNLALVGGSLAVAAATSVGQGDLISLLKALDNIFRPVRPAPRDCSVDVFVIQELTRIALALSLKSQVSNASNRGTVEEYETSDGDKLASWILDTIYLLLEDYPIEEDVTRPAKVWNWFLAILKRKASGFSDYYYLYGLLDCAVQVGRIVEVEAIPTDLIQRVQTIIGKSVDSSIRWKAMQFLISFRLLERDRLSALQISEADVIEECVIEQNDSLATKWQSRRRRSLVSTAKSVSNITKPGLLEPLVWMEPEIDYSSIQISNAAEFTQMALSRGRFRNYSYYGAGLSPNCCNAFALGEKELLVCPVNAETSQKNPQIDGHFRLAPCAENDFSTARATITNRFLAVLRGAQRLNLSVFQYSKNPDGGKVGSHTFKGWYPICLGMHEGPSCTCIAVGGCSKEIGSIRVFKVIDANGKFTLEMHQTGSTSVLSQPFLNDQPKQIDFSPDGQRLICLTKNNRVLTWLLTDNYEPGDAHFEFQKRYEAGSNARGIESVSFFTTSSSHSYVLCTTSPSSRRKDNGGELPFISPIPDCPAEVPAELQHDCSALGESRPMLAGAVDASGSVAAMLDNEGTVVITRLGSSETFSLCSLRRDSQLGDNRFRNAVERCCTTPISSFQCWNYCEVEQSMFPTWLGCVQETLNTTWGSACQSADRSPILAEATPYPTSFINPSPPLMMKASDNGAASHTSSMASVKIATTGIPVASASPTKIKKNGSTKTLEIFRGGMICTFLLLSTLAL